MWTVPDLNTRETATLVWAVVLIAFVLKHSDLRSSVAAVARILSRHPIRTVMVTTTCVVALMVVGLARIGYWQPTMTYETVVWFIGTGVVGTFNNAGPADLRRLLIKTVAVTSVVEFLTNAYTFVLPIELLLVPTVFFLLAGMGLVRSRADLAQTRRPLAALGIAVIVCALTPSVVHLLSHPGQVATADHVREFLLPLILTACFLPYLYAIRMIVVWQTTLVMLRHGMQDQPGLYAYAKRAVIRACGLSLARAQLFEPEYRWHLAAATSQDDVMRVLGDFRAAAADRPWRYQRQVTARDARSWKEIFLPSAETSGVLAHSVILADRVQAALAKASASTGVALETFNALLEKTGERSEFGAISLPNRAEMIRLLTEQGRSISEIESMAPPIAMLATMHDAEVSWLTERFDQILRLAGEPAANARSLAGMIHSASANAQATFRETVDALAIAYGGNVADNGDSAELAA